MRLSLWIVPTIGFVSLAAFVVQRESAETPATDPSAAFAEPAEIAGSIAPQHPFVLNDGEERPITSPPGGGPEPVWRIVDFGLSSTVLSPSDIPALAISNTTSARDEVPVQMAASEKSKAKSPWEVVGHSTRGRPIHVRHYGTAGDVTLVLCGMDGADRVAVKWIDSLSQQLADAPEMLSGRQIVLLRDANPDGLTIKQSPNERGVTLNHNFPTKSFRPGEGSGSGPASESETRAILEVLYRFQPARVIHVQSAGRSEVAANPAAQRLAETLGQGRQLAVQTLPAEQLAGSLEEFVTQTLSAEMLTLRLATGDDWRSAAIGHFPTLMAAAVPKIAEETLSVAQASQSQTQAESVADLAPSPFSEVTEITRLSRRGYEELPPPPHKPSW